MRVPISMAWLAAAAAVSGATGWHPDQGLLQHLVTAALVVVLFEGGRSISWPRLRPMGVPVALLGVVGTVGTTALLAPVVQLLLGCSWYAAVLVSAALAPTDPAVVFSVLGKAAHGQSGTVLEGESGANDPVGIALLGALLAAGSLSQQALLDASADFAVQLGVGLAVGVVGGLVLRRTPLDLLGAGLLYLAADAVHGSGLLAVFAAGVVLGGGGRWARVLMPAAEAVAFVLLGLAVRVGDLPGAALSAALVAAALAIAVRPLVVVPLLLGSPLDRSERRVVALGGLKGAVPLLLGSQLGGQPGGPHLVAVVVVAVVVSVLVQGAWLGRHPGG